MLEASGKYVLTQAVCKGPKEPCFKTSTKISTWLYRLGFHQPKLNSKASELRWNQAMELRFPILEMLWQAQRWDVIKCAASGQQHCLVQRPQVLGGHQGTEDPRIDGAAKGKVVQGMNHRSQEVSLATWDESLKMAKKRWILSTEWDSYEDVTTRLSTLTLTPSNFWQFFRAADVWWEVLAAEAKSLLEGRSQAHDKVYELRVLGQLHNLRVAFHTTLQGLPQTNSKASTCTLSHHVVGHLWEVRVAIVVVASSHHTHLLQVPSISFRVNAPVGIGMHLGMINIDDVVG